MISFALMLMTLPSRMAEARARQGESSTRSADRARQDASSTGGAVRHGLPHSSREWSDASSVREGERLDKSSCAARGNVSPAWTGRYNKER
jgi:hypothetical protein